LVMPKKRFDAKQIVTPLRQIEVLIAQDKATPVACRDAGISHQIKRRMPQSGDLLQLEGGASRHRAMVQALQHDPTALIARISTPCATDDEHGPDTARSSRTNAIVWPPRWYKKIRHTSQAVAHFAIV
jgi:hypothetical protein